MQICLIILFSIQIFFFINNFLIIITILGKLKVSPSRQANNNLALFSVFSNMVKFNGYSIFDIFKMKIYLRIYIFQIFDVENLY